MKKILCFILILMFVFNFSIFSKSKGEKIDNTIPRNLDLPKEIVIIGQSGTMIQLWITAIDLETNELIIIVYSHTDSSESEIENVIRTGIKIDPTKQNSIKGSDAPFQSPQPLR